MLESLKSINKTIGIKQTSRAIEEGLVQKVIVAQDVDESYVENLIELCKANSIEVLGVESKKYLGKISGIDVSAAVVGILKQ